MICNTCGKEIIRLSDYHTSSQCRKCRFAKMNEYQRTRRWLNGARDDRLLGEDLKVGRKVINGQMRIKIQ